VFIKKLNLSVDLARVIDDSEQIIQNVGWGDKNQISLVHRPSVSDSNEKWRDGVGSLDQDKQESDFNIINDQIPTYMKEILYQLAEEQHIKIGRTRLMNLPPLRGFSVHSDTSVRYHLVIKTHNKAYIGKSNITDPIFAICHHIPANGYFYEVDTRIPHFVFNGDHKPRIHLVICPI